MQAAAPALVSHHCSHRHLAFWECGGCGTQGMPPLSYFSNCPQITFRKPVFHMPQRHIAAGQLPAGLWTRGGLRGANAVLFSTHTQAVQLSRRVLPFPSASLLCHSWLCPARLVSSGEMKGKAEAQPWPRKRGLKVPVGESLGRTTHQLFVKQGHLDGPNLFPSLLLMPTNQS